MEEHVVTTAGVSYSGVFDFKNFYAQLYDIITGLGYVVEERKMIDTQHDTGKRIDFVWECNKTVDDYSQLQINIVVMVLNMVDVEAKKADQKIRVQKGDVTIDFKARLFTDYKNKWEMNPIFKFMKVVYDKYLYAAQFATWQDRVWNETYAVANEIKSFLNMHRFM
jgi:hypothetical protein